MADAGGAISLDRLERKNSYLKGTTPEIILTRSESDLTLESPTAERPYHVADEEDALGLTSHASRFGGRPEDEQVEHRADRSASPLSRKISFALAQTSQRVVNFHSATETRVLSRGSSTNWSQSQNQLAVQNVSQPQSSGGAWRTMTLENPLRQLCLRILQHPVAESLVLVLILFHAIILALDYSEVTTNEWGKWTDWALLGIFMAYTTELIARIIVSGALSDTDSTLSTRPGRDVPTQVPLPPSRGPKRSSKYNRLMPIAATLGGRRAQLKRSSIIFHHRAFLREAANRFDLICVLSFWIAFGLSISGVEIKYHFYLFRVISSLRIIRLLNITEGTATVLRSLHAAVPLLLDVGGFVAFFWIITTIIGVQSFKGSFRRRCVWVDSAGLEANITADLQFCGGHFTHGTPAGPFKSNWQPSGISPKGYICPEQSYCVQGNNPYGGTVSFDNLWSALELVFVVISSNTSTDLMYYAIDSDSFAACLFFICGTLLLSFWLVSLFIAVVTNSFSVNREKQRLAETQKKAAEKRKSENQRLGPIRSSPALKYWRKLDTFWISLIVAAISMQATKTADMSETWTSVLYKADLAFTLAFAVEIVGRFLAYLPNWRAFRSKSNFFDLFLVIITCVVQIPSVRHLGTTDEFYRWMTVFQILRVYRVIYTISFTRHLFLRIFGDVRGLLNLLFFVFCSVLIGALLAGQLFRDKIPEHSYGGNQAIAFRNFYDSFIGMYQILTTENWTEILYNVQMTQSKYHMGWLGAIFIVMWFIYAAFVLMSLFISVLSESLEVSEADKRREQVRTFVQRTLPSLIGHNKATPAMVTIFKKRTQRRSTTMDDFGNIMNAQNVQAFLADEIQPFGRRTMTIQDQLQSPIVRMSRKIMNVLRIRPIRTKTTQNPFSNQFSIVTDESMCAMDPHTVAEHVTAAQNDLRLQQKAYLARHPEYDQALWIFAPESKLRSWCQHVVASSYGERLQGHAPSLKLWYAVSTITYACTLVIVIVACLVTPIYQKAYRLQDGQSGVAWYTWLDLSMCIVFTLEASCKICADGFYLTPNGYLRNLWNKIDFVVVGTLWLNVVADLMDNGSVSRKVRAFKALRALRLVNVSDKTKEIFFDVFIAGFWNMLGAAISALSILIPMAVWAQNMFSGLLAGCNDSDVADKAACKNEFLDVSSPWPFLVPRQWDNPRTFSFDNFGRSLLVLFEITSQEGWTAVANSAAAITGRELQPQEDAAPRLRLFWVLFNIVGSVGVLTVFIAVILQNYSERSGLALYTTEQRSWAEIKSLLSQVRPSRRPADAPMAKWRRLAFFAVRKHSSWQRFILSTHVVHSVLLMTEHFPKTTAYTTTRNLLFFVILMIYVVNMAVRLLGLGWTLFWRGRWNIFNLAVLPMAIATSILTAISEDVLYLTLQKVSLVLLAMNLIREIDSLDILAKVAVASIPALASVLATWLVCFITFAIACNQILGLVKLGEHGHHNLNFRTVGKSLVSLYRMSLGEGWNALMHDYTIREPYCTDSSDFYLSDCGNAPWAYFLFISWNLLSMYIFVNVLLSIVFNNFSYVYQRAGIMGKISREEIRKFKHSWAQFDDGTGRIRCNDVGKFLHSLTGIFETKIYPDEQSVYNILSKCCIGLSETRSCIDLAALNKQLDTLDVSTIRERRLALNCIFMELTESDSISFNRALLVLAYNKFVDQSKSLQLLEFFKRREIRIRLLRSTREQQVVRFLECAWIKHLHARKRNNRKEDALLSRIDTQLSTRLSRRIQGNTYANNHDSSNFISRSASQRPCSEEQAMRDLMQASAWAPALAEEASRSEARPI